MPRLPDATQIRDVVPQTGGPMTSRRTGQVESAMSNLGQVISDAADLELNKIDDARAEDAFNRLREKQMELTLDPNKGYVNVRGRDAVNRKIPLIEDYSSQFKSSVDEIASTLSTDRQRQKFKQRADSAGISFKTDLLKHMMRETDSHRIEVLQGVVETEVQNAGANWQDPAAINQARARIEYNLSQVYGKTGKASEKMKADMFAAMSKVHSSVVSSAMAAGNYDYADSYFRVNNKEISHDEAIKFDMALRKVREDRAVMQDASEAVKEVMPRLAPDNFDRLNGLLRAAESNNRDYDKDGKPVTSAKGALYAQQVMPATAKDPGYGIKPAKDDSPEEYNRVGREYLGKMLEKYKGDVPKALAAYNAGPGEVDRAVAVSQNPKSEDSRPWLQHLPKETQEYVAKIMKQYAAGGDGGKRPTLQEVKIAAGKRVVARGGSPEEVAKAQAKAESLYNDVTQSLNQQADDVLTDIQARVDSGEITTYDQLTPTELSVLGQKRVGARSYIEGNSRRADKALELSPASTSFYFTMLTDPVALKNASIADIMVLAPEIGNNRVGKLLEQRKDYINRPESEKVATLDADQFRATAVRMGFNLKSDKSKKELLLIKDRTEDAIVAKQNELKRTLTREEKGEITKRMMVEIPAIEARRTGILMGGSRTTMAKRGYDVEYPENVIIPEPIKAKIKADAARIGRTLDDAQMRDVYIQMLIRDKQG